MKKALILGLVLGLSVWAFGAEYTFYIVSHGGPADPFWGKVIKGMQDAAALINAGSEDTIKAIYSGPAKYSVTEFVDMLNSAIAARPSGIAVTITDPTAVDEPLRQAINLGIPVIAINVPDPRPQNERIPYLLFVGADQYLAGVKAAERILSVRKPDRAIVAIHEVGHIGLELRAQGFIDTMIKAGVSAEKLATGLDPTQAVEILKSYFVKYPETNAIFTVGTIPSLYVISFLKEQNLQGKVLHAAHDVHDVILAAIKDGTTLLTISQRQYFQGYLPIIFLYLYNKYGFYPANDVLTGPSIIDSSNVEEALTYSLYW